MMPFKNVGDQRIDRSQREGTMSNIGLALNAELTASLASSSIGHAITSGALGFGKAEVRLLRILCGGLRW